MDATGRRPCRVSVAAYLPHVIAFSPRRGTRALEAASPTARLAVEVANHEHPPPLHSSGSYIALNRARAERTAVVADAMTLYWSAWWLTRRAEHGPDAAALSAAPLTAVEFRVEDRLDAHGDVSAVAALPLCVESVRAIRLNVGMRAHNTLSSLACLVPLIGLRELHMKRVVIDDDSARPDGGAATTTLATIMRRLETLSVGDYHLPRRLPIAELSQLADIDVSGTCADDALVTALARCSRLRRIRMAGCERATRFSPLGALPLLEDVDLSGTPLQDECLRAIVHGCRRLARVDIGGCWRLHDVTPLAGLSGLTELDLGRTDVAADSLQAVCSGALQLRRLRLCAVRTPLPHVRGSLYQSRLVLVDCSDSAMTNDSLAALGECAALESLALRNNRLLRVFAPLGNLTQLRELDLSGTWVGDKDVQALAHSCRQIRVLRLRGCGQLTDFAAVATLPAVMHLDVSDTSFGDAALSCLVERCVHLQRLDMHFCNRVTSLLPLLRAACLSYVGVGCVPMSCVDRSVAAALVERGVVVSSQVVLLSRVM